MSQVTQHCPRRDWTLKSTGKGKSQRLSFRQVARGDLSSRRNVITFTFQVTPRLITATGNSCWEEEVFSLRGYKKSLGLEPRTPRFVLQELHSDGLCQSIGHLCAD